MPTKIFIDRENGAKFLGVSLRHFDRIVEEHKVRTLRFRKNGKRRSVRLIFMKADIEAILASRQIV